MIYSLFFIAGAATAAPLFSEQTYQKSFTAWTAKHGKMYETTELLGRYAAFKSNMDFVTEHNIGGYSYTVALNEFADMTNDEFVAKYTGLKKGNRSGSKMILKSSDNPGSVDWTTKGAVTPVKNQGQCGSCWAFSTTGSTEGANFLKNGKLVSLSEQQLVDCAGSFGNQGCNGGLMDNGFQYIEKNGITTESSYPYTGTDGTCKSFSAAVQISGFTDVPSKSLSGLETAVSGQPTSVAVDAAGSGWQLYSGGVYSGGLFGCGQQLDHGVLAVGYDNDGGYWKIKNSWGTTWGEQGYIRLKKTSDATGAGTCGLALQASYPQAA